MPQFVQFTHPVIIKLQNCRFTILHSVDPKEDNSNFAIHKVSKKNKCEICKCLLKLGKLPYWHQGYGGDAFIFIDEITIK
jgi:hypothetical protein